MRLEKHLDYSNTLFQFMWWSLRGVQALRVQVGHHVWTLRWGRAQGSDATEQAEA